MVALLREFERAQDRSLALGGRLAAAIVAAQTEQQLAPSVTQRVFEEFGQSLASLTAARGRTIDAHKALEAIGRLFGITTAEEFGDGYKYPSAHRALNAVRATA